MSVFHSNIYFIKTRANLTECYVQCYLFDFITVCNYNEKDLVFDKCVFYEVKCLYKRLSQTITNFQPLCVRNRIAQQWPLLCNSAFLKNSAHFSVSSQLKRSQIHCQYKCRSICPVGTNMISYPCRQDCTSCKR